MNVGKLRLGLIGKDVSQSPSDKIHCFILGELGVRCEYEKISVGGDEFDFAMRRLLGDFDGFNVTIPYKRDVMEYLDETVGDAFSFSAVNTVVCRTRSGYNTDGIGFIKMLTEAGISVKGKRALVLGGGGSGRSTAVTLKNAGADVFMYQRRVEKLAETCRELSITPAKNDESEFGVYGGNFPLIVNCTGVGMHDTVGISPITEKAFDGARWAVELIHTPKQTEFLRLAKERGVAGINGAAMLFYQASYADCLYLEKMPNEREAAMLYERYKNKN